MRGSKSFWTAINVGPLRLDPAAGEVLLDTLDQGVYFNVFYFNSGFGRGGQPNGP
jgi:hypothetical protein